MNASAALKARVHGRLLAGSGGGPGSADGGGGIVGPSGRLPERVADLVALEGPSSPRRSSPACQPKCWPRCPASVPSSRSWPTPTSPR